MIKGRMPFRACGPFLCALLLCACGDRSRPSAEENEQLENAAEMLAAAPDELREIDQNALSNAERNDVEPD
jgi:hypothetical protein